MPEMIMDVLQNIHAILILLNITNTVISMKT